MKKYENKVRPAETYKALIEKSCDICGKKSERSDSWINEGFDKEQTEVSFTSGSYYPEGQYGNTIEFDICPECFFNKLKPFIESFGGVAEEREFDY